MVGQYIQADFIDLLLTELKEAMAQSYNEIGKQFIFPSIHDLVATVVLQQSKSIEARTNKQTKHFGTENAK